MAISEATVCSMFMVVTAVAASEQVEVHRLFGLRREARVMQQGAKRAVIPVSDRFGGDEAEVAFVDLTLDEKMVEVGESEAVICWRTSAWREMLNVEVWAEIAQLIIKGKHTFCKYSSTFLAYERSTVDARSMECVDERNETT